MDGAGSVWVADEAINPIRKIMPAAEVTTLAGSGVGYLGGAGTAVRFDYPSGIGIDGDGNLFVSNLGNHRIGKIVVD